MRKRFFVKTMMNKTGVMKIQKNSNSVVLEKWLFLAREKIEIKVKGGKLCHDRVTIKIQFIFRIWHMMIR